ncbi:MAG: hypothetical protein EXQ58_05645 [Acidobacteria bacterium]|nr:hypothetical protein [Acidobacteriota bacterium]
MKTWLVFVLTLFVSQVVHTDSGSQRFISLGSFSNMKFTEEHQYGAKVQLWREGTELLGLFSYSEGLIGDTPTCLLKHTKYDPQTGNISFHTKLTTSQHFCKIHKDVPSHDQFDFQGKLSNSSAAGVLKRSDALHPENPPTEEKVVLKKLVGEEANQTDYRSRSEWESAS